MTRQKPHRLCYFSVKLRGCARYKGLFALRARGKTLELCSERCRGNDLYVAGFYEARQGIGDIRSNLCAWVNTIAARPITLDDVTFRHPPEYYGALDEAKEEHARSGA